MPDMSPIRTTDDQARALARGLIDTARFGALATLDPATGAPAVTRVAVGTDARGTPVTLVSELSAHTRAMRADARVSLLLGEPADRGDPLSHPRLTLHASARFIDRAGADHSALRGRWLADHPKAKLYVDFADFGFVLLVPHGASLNGGFGRAFDLTAQDLHPVGGLP